MISSQRQATAVAQRRAVQQVKPAAVRPRVVANAGLGDVMKGGAAALAAAVLLTAQPGLARDNLESIKGTVPFGRNTPAEEVGKKVLDDVPAIDSSIQNQPNAAVRQAADEVRKIVVDQAKELAEETEGGLDVAKSRAAQAPGVSAKQAPGVVEQAVQGLQTNLAQIKSIVDPE